MIFRHLSRFLGSIQKTVILIINLKSLDFLHRRSSEVYIDVKILQGRNRLQHSAQLEDQRRFPVVAILAPGLPHAVALKLMGRHSLLVFLRALHLKKCLWKCVEGCLLILSQLLNKRLCNAIGPWFESMPLLHPAHKDSEVRIQLCCSPFRLPAGTGTVAKNHLGLFQLDHWGGLCRVSSG